MVWPICATRCHSALTKKKIPTPAAMRIRLESLVLLEISQTTKGLDWETGSLQGN